MRPTVLRWLAVVIAMLAVIDPAMTIRRPARPLVSLVTTDPTAGATTDRVGRILSRRFDVVEGMFSSAAATVLVGARLPDEAPSASGPVVAVLPVRAAVTRISALTLPTVAPRDSRIPVEVSVSSIGSRGQRLQVELEADGIVVDARTVDLQADMVVAQLNLGWAPAMAGAVPVRVTARVQGTRQVARATTVVEVTEAPFRILFFDARPSWHSTFVRRAVEDDARFAVSHRLMTSRGVANLTGTPPTTLADHRGLIGYHLVVIGAPDALGPSDVAGLEAYLRRRGGRVILLLDRRAPTSFDRIMDVGQWRTRRFAAPATVAVDSGALRARELAWPASLPVAATAVGSIRGVADSGGAPLWSVPVGVGRLVVSGALDAWHYRDPGASDFNRFWRQAMAGLCSGTPGLVDVDVSRQSLRPGERTAVSVMILGDVIAGGVEPFTAGLSAVLVAGTDTTPIRLWPGARPGHFTGDLVAPRAPGTYRLVVGSDVVLTERPVVVDSLALSPQADESGLVSALAASRGGATILETELARLPGLLAPALRAASRVDTWHPMRSPWWIVPFALSLGAEWWWRRRRGLP